MGNPEFYFTTLDNGWTVGRFAALDAVAGIVHAVTTRKGLEVGLVRHEKAAAADRIAAALGLREAAYVEQVHGGVVLSADRGGLLGEADGLVGGSAGLGILTRSADCTLILAVDPVSKVIGTAHASWRGTVAKIAMELAARMTQRGAEAGRIVACICPSAGPCCYEVGAEVEEVAVRQIGGHAAEFFHRPARSNGGGGGRKHLDLWSANRDQLLRSGLAEGNIHVAGVCTMCRNNIFPSHRMEADGAGRFAAAIGRV